MRIRSMIAAVAILSLAATPALAAAANPAASLSVAGSPQVRASSATGAGSSRATPEGWVVLVGALGLGAAALFFALNEDDQPESP